MFLANLTPPMSEGGAKYCERQVPLAGYRLA